MTAYQQGKIFRRFKTNNKFISAVSAMKITKAMINFKIDIVKFIDMYPKMQTSAISLYYIKNNFRRQSKKSAKNRLVNFSNIFLENIFNYFKVKKKSWFTVKQRSDFSLYLKNYLLKAFHS